MEANDMKAMREALSDACYAMFNFLKTQSGDYEEMANALDKAKAALSKPLRNCEVGTAEEQRERMMEYCKTQEHIDGIIICERCPLHGPDWTGCVLRWAQMPYQKGGAE